MKLITDSKDLGAFCESLANAPYITVDTEFLRDSTYWPKLCLVQVGAPGAVAAIDTQAEGLELSPLFALLRESSLTKVFHSARQDMEIFHILMEGDLPAPIFDTQVAAMVCGYGEQVGYDTLARKITGARIDKASRYADWSARPLTERQLDYALADVTHLRGVYESLRARLDESGRATWVEEEMAILTDPATYRMEPQEAWRRLRPRSTDRGYLSVMQAAAAWREIEAQRRDVPRNRVIRDEQIQDIAAQSPRTVQDLARTRGLSGEFARGRLGTELLGVIEAARNLPKDERPTPSLKPELPSGLGPVVELLKVLLKAKCEEHGVAQKLVANSADLELIAADDNADVSALRGWRRDVFGEDALALKHGRIALAAENQAVKLVRLSQEATPQAAASS